jgi:hypothetical protein
MGKNISLDKYGLRARVFPAIITIVIPIFVFSHFYINPELSYFCDEFSKFSLIGDIAISIIFMFYLSQYARMIGKKIFEEKYFKGESNMPTTDFMLFNNSEYSDDYKVKIRQKIFADFALKLHDKTTEALNEDVSRKKIVEAVSLIRKKLFGNKFLLQHNIEYGAMRNTIGGAVMGSILSLINIAIFYFAYPNKTAVIISGVALTVYIILLLLSKPIIKAYGRAYAKILIREYMSS